MLHEFPDTTSAAAAQADAVERLLHAALAGGGAATLALSGGRSPIPFFEDLSRRDLDWPRVALRLIDERLVAPDHPDSNERLVRSHLLQNRAAQARFEGLAPREDGAAALAAQLRRSNRDPPPLHVVVLGMGEDGHIASLFSGAPEFAAATELAAGARYRVIHPPIPPVEPPHPRISMTLAALLAADRLVLAFSGAAKREMFERASRQPRADLPISLLLDAAKTRGRLDVYWHP